jgi:hypothetical protein
MSFKEVFSGFIAKIGHRVIKTQLDRFVSRNKKVFEELARK